MKHWFIVLIVLLLTGSAFGQSEPCPLNFAQTGGGASADDARSVATDAAGNVYVTGTFVSQAKFGSVTLTATGSLTDVYVVKYNPAGTVLWAVRAGSANGDDSGNGIAVGANGVYVTGTVRGNNVTFGSRTINTVQGSRDIFLAEYDFNGNLNWVWTAGGSKDDVGTGVAIDAAGDLYLSGWFEGAGAFPLTFQGVNTAPIFTLTSQANFSSDAFIVKFNNTSDSFQWGASASGSGSDKGNGVAVDNAGNVYVSGSFSSSTLGFGSLVKLNQGGNQDIFLAQYNASTGGLNWALTSGGASADYGEGVAVDNVGNVYQTGRYIGTSTSPARFEAAGGVFQSFTSKADDIFVAKYTSMGALTWLKGFGGTGIDHGLGIAADPTGVVVAGKTFASGPGSFFIGSKDLSAPTTNQFDPLVFTLDANGTPEQANRYGASSANAEEATAVAIYQNRYYAVGRFTAINQFVTGQPVQAGGVADAFVIGFDCQAVACTLNANAGFDQSVGCGQSATLTGSFSGNQGAVSTIWTRASDNAVVGTTSSITVSPSQTASYIFTVTDAAGCAISDQVVVSVAGTITVNAGNDVVINPGQSVTLTATGPANATYTWTATGGFIQSGQSISVTPSSTTTYTVTASSGGCSGSDAVAVSVQAGSGCPPGVSIFANGVPVDFPLNICVPGGSVSLTAVPAAQGNHIYRWFRDVTGGDVSDAVVVGDATPNLVVNQGGFYFVEIVSQVPGCINSRSTSVNVIATVAPVAVISASATTICQGQSVTLSAQTSAGATYAWTTGAPLGQAGSVLVSNNQTVAVTPSVGANSYFLTTSIANSACPSATASTVINVGASAGNVVITASGPTALCSGSSVTLIAPSGNGFLYQWRNNNVSINGANQSSLVVTSNGSYTVFVTVAGSNCAGVISNALAVSFNAAPTANATVSANNVCAGTIVTLSTPEVFGATYSWTDGVGTVVGSTRVVNVTALQGANTYFVTVNVPNSNCPSAVSSVTLNATAGPGAIVISASGPTTLCSGSSVTLIAPIGAGFSYQWRNNGVNINGANQSSLLVTSNGNYTVFVSVSGSTCPGVASNNIVVAFNAAPTANAVASNNNVCSGTNVQLSTPAVSGATYSWTVGSPNGAQFSTSANTFVNAQIGSTTYFVTVTIPNSNCPSAVSSVTVNASQGSIAQQITALSATTFCAGGSVTLSAPFIANYAYQWRYNGIDIPNATGTTYVATEGGSYSLAVREFGNICPWVVSNTIGVEVIEQGFLPIPSTAPSGSATLNFCAGATLPISTPFVDGYTYTWFFNGSEIPGSNSNMYVATQPGVYHVMVSLGEGCTRRKSEGLFVTSEYAPFSFVTKYDAQICPESNVKIGLRIYDGDLDWDDDYTVTFDPPFMQVLEPLQNVSFDTLKMLVLVKPIQTTTYNITVKDVNGCTQTQQITIFVGPIQAPEISGPACVNDYPAFTLVNASESSYTYYQWRRRALGATGTFTVDNSTVVSGQNTPTLTPNGAGLYRLYVSNPGCPIVASNIITILASPSVVGTDRTICQTATTTLTATGVANVSGSLSYAWFNSAGQQVFSSAGPNSVSVANGQLFVGVNEFTVQVTNANNCTASDLVTVNVAPTIGTGSLTILGNGSLDADFSICPGGSIELSTDFIDGVTYTWRLNGVVIAGSTNSITATSGGSYQVTASNTCGSRSGTRTVTVRPVPTVSIPTVSPICYGGSRQLNASISLSGVSVNNIPFTWSPSDGSLSDGSVRNPVASPMVTTTYTLTATNPNNGCTNSATVTVTVDQNLGPIARSSSDMEKICVGSSTVIRYFNDGNLGATTGNTDGASDIIYRWDRLTENGPVLIETGNLPNATIGTLTVTPNASTTYVLTLTDPDLECVSTCYIHITVGMLPVATVQPVGSLNLCDGPLKLRSICNAANNVTYQWYVDATNSNDWVAIPGATDTIYYPQTGGTYTVRVTDVVNNACWDYANNPVTAIGVRPGAQDGAVISARQNSSSTEPNGEWVIPTASVVYCLGTGNGVRLRANYIFNVSYQWYRNGEEIAGANSTTLDVYEPGNYQVKLTTCSEMVFPCDDCVGMSKICSVLGIPAPKPLINHVSTVVLCNNESVELYTQNMSAIYNYQWQRNNLGTWVDVDGAWDYNFFTNQEGEYRVIVTVKWDQINAGGSFITDKCTAISVNTVVVSNEYGVTITPVGGDGSGTCTGNVTALKAVVASNITATGFTWFRLSSTGVETQVGTGQMLTLTQPGTYFVRLDGVSGIAISDTCDGRNSAPVLVEGLGFGLTVDAVGDVCLDLGNFTLNSTVNTLDVVTYDWTSSTGSSLALLSSTSVADPTFDATTGGAGAYSYTLTATNTTNGCSSSQTVAFNVVDCAAITCETPSNVNAVAVGTDEIVVTWDLSLDPNVTGGYHIQYASTAAPDVIIDQVDVDLATNTFTFTGVANGQYDVTVFSICTLSPLKYSDPTTVSGVTLPTGVQPVVGCNAAPNGLVVSNITATGATFTWNAVQGTIVNYQLRYRPTGSTSWQTKTSTTNTVTITGLIPNTEYEYRLRTNCGTGNTPATSPFTDIKTFTTINGTVTDCSQPPVISGVTPGCVDVSNNTTATVTWLEIPTATSYRVEWRVNGSSTPQWSDVTAPANTLTIPFLAPGTTYRLRMRATCPSGTTAFSAFQNFTTGTTPCAGRIGSAADAAANANVYQVYPNPNKGAFTVAVEAVNAGAVGLTLLDLTGRTVYAQNHTIEAGENSIPVELNGTVAQGVYMLELIHNGEKKTVKVIVE